MSNKKPLLTELISKGKPLAEVVIIEAEDASPEEVADMLDHLSPDIDCSVVPAYFQNEDGSLRYEVRMNATKEALKREFGWLLIREPLPKWDQKKQEYDGVYEDAYCWKEINSPQFYPKSVESKILEMGLTQPGVNDNGAKDDINYEAYG
ncbi:hypothetical protein [Spartinivicinus ruber]|uniref:hypothetical protein n=1 Tax=Spartinivicinus ruber TaxID=2683272 RepID=UPI0013D02E0E|nr:hypothetical protein [Spartinivicinus ruber]